MGSAAIVRECLFFDNIADADGGAMIFFDGGALFNPPLPSVAHPPQIINSVFKGNRGGVVAAFGAQADMINCTIANNIAHWPMFLISWGDTQINNNGVVDISDLLVLFANWG